MSAWRHPWRVGSRLARFLRTNARGLREHRIELRARGLDGNPRACAAWLHRYASANLECLGFRCERTGRVPERGLVVCNHLGYLDIAVLASTGPMVFVSKAEVARWPLLGALAKCGGTLFLRREQRAHVAEVASALRPIVEGGTVVALFPEGTSSGGGAVLPFRSSLLEPAASNGWPVTPAWLTYDIDPSEGTLAEDVAYWRDMTFAPHFLNLLSKTSIVARVRYGEPMTGVADRKELTRHLHAEVRRMRAEGGNLTNL